MKTYDEMAQGALDRIKALRAERALKRSRAIKAVTVSLASVMMIFVSGFAGYSIASITQTPPEPPVTSDVTAEPTVPPTTAPTSDITPPATTLPPVKPPPKLPTEVPNASYGNTNPLAGTNFGTIGGGCGGDLKYFYSGYYYDFPDLAATFPDEIMLYRERLATTPYPSSPYFNEAELAKKREGLKKLLGMIYDSDTVSEIIATEEYKLRDHSVEGILEKAVDSNVRYQYISEDISFGILNSRISTRGFDVDVSSNESILSSYIIKIATHYLGFTSPYVASNRIEYCVNSRNGSLDTRSDTIRIYDKADPYDMTSYVEIFFIQDEPTVVIMDRRSDIIESYVGKTIDIERMTELLSAVYPNVKSSETKTVFERIEDSLTASLVPCISYYIPSGRFTDDGEILYEKLTVPAISGGEDESIAGGLPTPPGEVNVSKAIRAIAESTQEEPRVYAVQFKVYFDRSRIDNDEELIKAKEEADSLRGTDSTKYAEALRAYTSLREKKIYDITVKAHDLISSTGTRAQYTYTLRKEVGYLQTLPAIYVRYLSKKQILKIMEGTEDVGITMTLAPYAYNGAKLLSVTDDNPFTEFYIDNEQ